MSPVVRTAEPTGSPHTCAIAVMAKASRPGRTKTRLAPPLSLEQAAELNTVFLADVAANVRCAAQHARIACFMAFGPPESAPFFQHHLPVEVGLVTAWYPGFGDCLRHAAEQLLGLGYGAAVVLNSDSPTLPTALLAQTAERLLAPGERIVLGPSTDGGYYLLGMKQAHPRLFADIEWSTERVFEQTRQRAAELGLETVCLPPWYDVDDAASLQCLTRELVDGVGFSQTLRSYDAPHTKAFLLRGAADGSLGAPSDSPSALAAAHRA